MPIRVLIVDDSALMRRAIAALLSSDPDIEVVGTAQDGQAAIELVAKLRPQVITMDVRMPVMDGAETTEHIMAYYPTPILVLTASLSEFDIDITFKMLGLGALDVMEKPSSDDPGGLQHARAELLRRVKTLSRVKVVTHLRGRRRETGDVKSLFVPVALSASPSSPVKAAPRLTQGKAQHLVVIGASTGGPRVVNHILSQLPASFNAAILIVQHIASGFTDGMVEWLNANTALNVQTAHSGDIARPGQVYVAPDDLHLLIDADGVLSLASQPRLIQRPSIDITMQVAAEMYGAQAIGVLLTGMGRDGVVGMSLIERAGGATIAQSGDSCVVFGMPRAAIEAGAVQNVLAPERIPEHLQLLLLKKLVGHLT